MKRLRSSEEYSLGAYDDDDDNNTFVERHSAVASEALAEQVS